MPYGLGLWSGSRANGCEFLPEDSTKFHFPLLHQVLVESAAGIAGEVNNPPEIRRIWAVARKLVREDDAFRDAG
jgi:hypothetical protein